MPDDFPFKRVVFRSPDSSLINVGTLHLDGDSAAFALDYVFPKEATPARPRTGVVLFAQLDSKNKPQLMAFFPIGAPRVVCTPTVVEMEQPIANDQT
jgi:hypothetical protein